MSMYAEEMTPRRVRFWGWLIGSAIAWLVLILLVGGMWGCPKYNVWQQKLAGEAELAKSIAAKQVSVQEALAKKDSATLLAEAEVERAKGVAQANKIIGESLKDHEEYLRYLYIQNLADKQNEIVYVPTEAGLPILEAGRRIKIPEPVVVEKK